MFSSGNRRRRAEAVSHSTACLYKTHIRAPHLTAVAGMEDYTQNGSFLLDFMVQTLIHRQFYQELSVFLLIPLSELTDPMKLNDKI